MLNRISSSYSQIMVNGEVFNCVNNMSLIDLLIYLDFNPKLITVEYNSEIVAHDDMSYIFLKSDDNIEIITIVGGG